MQKNENDTFVSRVRSSLTAAAQQLVRSLFVTSFGTSFTSVCQPRLHADACLPVLTSALSLTLLVELRVPPLLPMVVSYSV